MAHHPIASIVYLAADNKHTVVKLDDREHLVCMRFGQLAGRLDRHFVQIHRSELVNVRAVERIEPSTHGDAIAILRDGSARVVTRTHRRALLVALGRT